MIDDLMKQLNALCDKLNELSGQGISVSFKVNKGADGVIGVTNFEVTQDLIFVDNKAKAEAAPAQEAQALN